MTAVGTTPESVTFVTPMPGLHPYTAFSLHAVDGAAGLFALRSVEADVRLFLLDASDGPSEYEPRVPAVALEEIGAAATEDVRVLVVANPADDGIHLNLRAPLLVHRETGRALQVILDDQDYPLRARLGG
ncbi:flagellar assembly protein FliW [uncultured Microbacterium sp.]|uniref:flagellar assembly protein FliW n=1 Tax=uncultured Microbacterium sp. TaxID=191216 RepID=UPI0028DCDA39|nr:flagellar assembly protein FliW [uncultured Microbacterium sp.]